jgi:Helix-turn-helix domain
MPTTWIGRVWCEFRAANLSRAERDTLSTLASYRSAGGLCFPSHATLAERAKVCVRTVQRALAAARDLGLVSWAERRIRSGWRWLRTSNSYRLAVPAGVVQRGLRLSRPRPTTNGLSGRGGERSGKKHALEELLRDAAALPDLLAARRASFNARQRQITDFACTRIKSELQSLRIVEAITAKSVAK